MSTTDSEQMIASNTRQTVSIQIEIMTAVENALLARIDRSPEEYATLAATFQVSRIQSDALKNWLADEEDGHHDPVGQIDEELSYDKVMTDWLKVAGFIVEIQRDEERSGYVRCMFVDNDHFSEVGFTGWKPGSSHSQFRENMETQGYKKYDFEILPDDVQTFVAERVTPREWRSKLLTGVSAYTDQVKIWVRDEDQEKPMTIGEVFKNVVYQTFNSKDFV
jgi:hypothetical protein